MRKAIITILFGCLLCGLLAIHISSPWQFSNDDNGAWFSAIARTHCESGLRATHGQDFFTGRETGKLVPYLHHPPLPGLILATAFSLTGHDSPLVARVTFALLHVITFLIIAILSYQIWDEKAKGWFYAYALSVVAAVPMSTFYGKMPNHEVPGLLFFVAGVAVWGFIERKVALWRAAFAIICWMLALFSSWHAAFCIVAWLLVRWDRQRGLRYTLALLAVLLVEGIVILHLYWANGWQALPSQTGSLGHWSWFASGESIVGALSSLQHALGIGTGRYAYLPAVLAISWLWLLLKDRVLGHQSLSIRQRSILGLSAGSVAYAVIFPHAVRNHAYQGFYLIPFVALASSVVISRWCARDHEGRGARFVRLLPPLLLVLTCVLGIATTLHMYRKPSKAAVKAAGDIQAQYR
jgi:hypothetical protein